MSDPLDELISLTNAKRVGTSWRALCPAHDDQAASLNITRGRTRPVVIYCHAGCPTRDILRALGLADDFLSRESSDECQHAVGATRQNGHAPRGGSARIVVSTTRYTIAGRDGLPVAIHVRKDMADGGKMMPWEWPDGSSSSPDHPIEPARLPLYRTDSLHADPIPMVFLTEGEKAADALAQLGVVALGTVTGAASTPGPDALAVLTGQHVVLWPDNDDVGREHMARIGRALAGVASSVATLHVPSLPDHGDAADWEGSYDDLLGLVSEELIPAQTGGQPIDELTLSGATSGNAASFPSIPLVWPVLDPVAYHGPIGDVVLALEPFTEADPAGVLVAMVVQAGVVLGRARVLSVAGGGVQAPNLFAMLVGDSATGRKGTAVTAASAAIGLAYPDLDKLLVTGLGSGEGLVTHLKRAIDKAAASPGSLVEYRVLIDESEVARLLAAMGREGSTLSAMLRSAFDGTPLGHTVAATSTTITWHHVGLLGQVTPEELRDKLSVSERSNGFANRFLWIAVRRQRLIPFAEHPRRHVPASAVADMASAFAASTRLEQLSFTPLAAELWEHIYAEMGSIHLFGTLDVLTSREITLTLRVATIFALMDRSLLVDIPHLEAARAIVEYSRASIRWIWSAVTGDREADALLTALKSEGPIAWAELRDYGLRGAEAERVVAILTGAGLAVVEIHPTRSKPRRVVSIVAETRHA